MMRRKYLSSLDLIVAAYCNDRFWSLKHLATRLHNIQTDTCALRFPPPLRFRPCSNRACYTVPQAAAAARGDRLLLVLLPVRATAHDQVRRLAVLTSRDLERRSALAAEPRAAQRLNACVLRDS